jgi:DNA-binding transcriptional MocR family regulator
VEALPLSRYALSPLPRGGLVLGYAGASHREIRQGVRRLKAVLARA